MSRDSIFSRIKNKDKIPFHPLNRAMHGQRVDSKSLKDLFADCDDFTARPLRLGGGETVQLCWIDGLVSSADMSEYVIRPLTEAELFPSGLSAEDCAKRALVGGVWVGSAKRRDNLGDTAEDLLNGFCALVFDGPGTALTYEIKTSNSRSVSEPTVEKSVKGAKDAFVETIRTNTSLVRRKLRSTQLKVVQRTLGRKSGTSVAVIYLDGVANPETVEELLHRLDNVDIDGLDSAGGIEQYITERPGSVFPQLIHTERPDKFASELVSGRVGLIADGLPIGFILPATLASFMKVEEDKSLHFLVSSGLMLLRWISALLSLLMPAAFIALAMYHQDMIPSKLLLSMIDAKQKVPFSSAFEVLTMLLAFELLLEAGLRLPNPVGNTMSIIGALIVGQSAVEAKVVSPISVIIVATAGICGFTMPSRDLGAALRLLRFFAVFVSMGLGVFGLMLGIAMLIWYLAGMDSFGVPYISPLAEGGFKSIVSALVRPPLYSEKTRETALKTPDRRNQK